MHTRESLRSTIESWIGTAGSGADLDELSELGAVHYEVLEMMAERIHRLHEAGYSKAAIHAALSDDVVLARRMPEQQTGT